MDKSKILLIAIGTVSVLAALMLGLAAMKRFDAASAARSARDTSEARLSEVYSREIFPNEDNVGAMDSVLERFAVGREAFTNALTQSNVSKSAPDEYTPSVFLSKLAAGVRNLRAAAPLVDGRKAVAEDFCFGFDAYFGRDEMPDSEEVPLMVQQLSIIAMLSRELYGAQVSQVVKIVRDARDKATLATKQGGSSSRRSDQSSEQEPQPRGKKNKKKSAEEARAPLFVSQRFEIEFLARQTALVNFVNRIDSMKRPFVSVRSISVKKTGEGIRSAPQPEQHKEPSETHRPARTSRQTRRPRRGEERAAAEPAAPAEPAQIPLSEQPAEMRIVSGPDIDPLLSVKMELDIFNFGEEEGR